MAKATIKHEGYVHDKDIDKSDVKTFFKGVRKRGSDRQEKVETDPDENNKDEWEQSKERIKRNNERQR